MKKETTYYPCPKCGKTTLHTVTRNGNSETLTCQRCVHPKPITFAVKK